MFSNFLPPKSCLLWDVEKCRAGQATCGNKIRRMRFAFWITTDTDTHSEYAILRFLFHGNNGNGNAPQCYVIHTLPVLFSYIHACCMPHPSQSPWFDYSHLTYVLLSAATFHKAAALNFCHFAPTLSFQDKYTKSYEVPTLCTVES